jgi:putative spermidine/putrescine transport system substrate-binding protein
MSSRKAAALAAVSLAAASLFASAAAAKDTLAVASYGGAYQEALRKAHYTPTEDLLGIEIKEYTLSGIGDLRAQVQAGAVEWDVVELYGGQCEQAAREGLTLALDYSVIDADGIPPELIKPNWVGYTAYSTVLAYNKDVYGDNPPKSWADFWDVEKFPGTRALSGYGLSTNAEFAMMAAGVPIADIYPIDLQRAIEKMREIKPHITVWWNSGAQAMQLAQSEEVDMLSIWIARIDAAIKEGAPYAYDYNQALLDVECLVVPKGAKNPELAMKAIAHFVSPDLQANLPQYVNYGPVNQKAFETGKITPEQAASSNSSPENLKNQIIQDKAFWTDNGQKGQEMWDKFMQE